MQGRREDAEALLHRMLRTYEGTFGPEHPDLLPIINELGAFYAGHGQRQQAESFLQRSLRISEKSFGVFSMAMVRTLGSMAELHERCGQTAQAEREYLRALAIGERLPATRREGLTVELEKITDFYFRQRNAAMAASVFGRVVRLYQEELDPGNPSLATIFDYMAEFCLAAKLKKEARDWRRRATEVRRASTVPK
jgi:tetratricopeptide (TPR) repeat protein